MILNQLHSIGDILFCEPIFRNYWQRDGVKPMVPIRDHLFWMSEYIESANFIKESDAIKAGMDLECTEVSPGYMPLRWANQILRGYDKNDHHDFENMMLDKYRLCGLDPMLWKTLEIKFNYSKAFILVNSYNADERRVVINTHSQAGEIKVGSIGIPMSNKRDFSVLDWVYLIAGAEENHHVSTCTFFIFQAIFNQVIGGIRDIHLYARPNEDGLRGISQLNPDFDFTAHDSDGQILNKEELKLKYLKV